MASLDTFDWLVREFLQAPDDATQAMIRRERARLMNMRNENERRRRIEELLTEIHSERKTKRT